MLTKPINSRIMNVMGILLILILLWGCAAREPSSTDHHPSGIPECTETYSQYFHRWVCCFDDGRCVIDQEK
jgi:hypothetical protein